MDLIPGNLYRLKKPLWPSCGILERDIIVFYLEEENTINIGPRGQIVGINILFKNMVYKLKLYKESFIDIFEEIKT